jgi:hypothetical protein
MVSYFILVCSNQHGKKRSFLSKWKNHLAMAYIIIEAGREKKRNGKVLIFMVSSISSLLLLRLLILLLLLAPMGHPTG